MSKEIQIKQECCYIWNKLKDKSKMIDYLIVSKQQIAELEAKLAKKERKNNVRVIYYFIMLGGTNAAMVQYSRYSSM